MGKEIDWEIRDRAEESYVVEGLTFEQVAGATGVSISQLKNWAAAEDWRKQREEYRAARKGSRENLMALRTKLAKEALSNPDPQNIYAFVRLETLSLKEKKTTETAAPKIDKPALFMEAVEFIAGYLKETDPEGLKILARNFDGLITAFKAKHAQAT